LIARVRRASSGLIPAEIISPQRRSISPIERHRKANEGIRDDVHRGVTHMSDSIMRRYFMNRVFTKSLALATIADLSLTADVAPQKGPDQKKKDDAPKTAVRPMCVVMDDDPINFRVSVMSDNGPVYFCCKDCIKKFQANPQKYADQAKAQREALAKLPRVQ